MHCSLHCAPNGTGLGLKLHRQETRTQSRAVALTGAGMSNELRLVGSLEGQAFLSASFTTEACSLRTEKFAALVPPHTLASDQKRGTRLTRGVTMAASRTSSAGVLHRHRLERGTKGTAGCTLRLLHELALTGRRSGSRAGRASFVWVCEACKRSRLPLVLSAGGHVWSKNKRLAPFRKLACGNHRRAPFSNPRLFA